METKGRAFLERVRHAYLAQGKRDPRTVLISGEPPAGEVHGRVMQEIDRVL